MAGKSNPMKRATHALKLVSALALLCLPACTAEVPASPTYTNDVRPILMAHCVRCHGGNNDTLVTMPVYGVDQAPLRCYLQRYEDAGDCTMASTCKHGAGYCGMQMGGPSLIVTYINATVETHLRMPPPPSDPLTDWEKEVLTRWSTANPAQ
jgi:hypothetical protein